MLDMIGANAGGKADRDHHEAAEQLDGESHGHWVNPFRNSIAGPSGGKAGAKGGAAAAQFWKQPRRWLHVDATGKTSYVTVRPDADAYPARRSTDTGTAPLFPAPQHASHARCSAVCGTAG